MTSYIGRVSTHFREVDRDRRRVGNQRRSVPTVRAAKTTDQIVFTWAATLEEGVSPRWSPPYPIVIDKVVAQIDTADPTATTIGVLLDGATAATVVLAGGSHRVDEEIVQSVQPTSFVQCEIVTAGDDGENLTVALNFKAAD